MELVTFLFRHRLVLLKVCVLSSFVVRLLHQKTTTWCQEWDQICELLTATVSSANQADCYYCFTLVETKMAELAGLPIPTMDWHSPDAPQAFKKLDVNFICLAR